VTRTKTPRVRKPRCACGHPGFSIIGPALDGRPEFCCGKCNQRWTSGHDGEPYWSAAQNGYKFLDFGGAARACGMTVEQASGYVGGANGGPNLSTFLRIVGYRGDYHSYKIHEDDIYEFVHSVLTYRRETKQATP